MSATQTLFGVGIDALTMEETVARCRQLAHDGGLHQHVVLNAAKVVEMNRDPRLVEIVRSCSLVNADGAPIVWTSRLCRKPLPERVAGIDLFLELVAAAARDGDGIYLLGARPEVVAKVAATFLEKHPGLVISGIRDGFWEDEAEVIEDIRAAKPTYLFLAIPSPRKEFWLNEHLADLDVAFVMGVGGSFDVVAGVASRAPRWMQKVGMEWSWRLILEPRRMWKRYLFGNSKFLASMWREWRGQKDRSCVSP